MCKPDGLSSIPGTHCGRRELTPEKLSTDLRIHAVAYLSLSPLVMVAVMMVAVMMMTIKVDLYLNVHLVTTAATEINYLEGN